METQGTQRKPRQQRSPIYPSLDLATALRRAEQLYRSENRHFAPITAILQAWGYSPKSSGGRLAVAALKRYGLIEDRGSLEAREARITDLAQAIILDQREESAERQERIRDAALTVPLIREILDKYPGGLPSDATLQFHLTVERGFSEGGASEFIEVLRKTLAFAQLPLMIDGGDRDESESELEIEARPSRESTATAPDRASVFRGEAPMPGAPPPIQFPVAGGATVTLQSTAPLTEAAWTQMMAVLNALKSAIVVADHPPAPEGITDAR